MSDSVTPWTVGHQAPLSMEFSRQEYLEWVSIPFSKGSSWPRDQTHVSCIADRDSFTVWAIRGVHIILKGNENEIVDFENALTAVFHFLSTFHSGLSLSKYLYFGSERHFYLILCSVQ